MTAAERRSLVAFRPLAPPRRRRTRVAAAGRTAACAHITKDGLSYETFSLARWVVRGMSSSDRLHASDAPVDGCSSQTCARYPTAGALTRSPVSMTQSTTCSHHVSCSMRLQGVARLLERLDRAYVEPIATHRQCHHKIDELVRLLEAAGLVAETVVGQSTGCRLHRRPTSCATRRRCSSSAGERNCGVCHGFMPAPVQQFGPGPTKKEPGCTQACFPTTGAA